MINVTKPFLPPMEEYQKYVKGIWERVWLTNNGPLVNELELKLKDYLGVPHVFFLGNGTIALQIAIKALDLKGEIITTPFSYVATTSSIAWENCKPVFVDIDPRTFNINADLIEAAITENTTGIMATHVYGNPCDVEKIQAIAEKHNLKVIYDGAHAFGTGFEGKSVLNYGDITTLSFHATKLFHTTEGGAIATTNAELAKKVAYLRNFGHATPETFHGIGVNGKNSEFHAAMGLCNLKYIDEIRRRRKELSDYYDIKIKSLHVSKPAIQPKADFNYSYYAIVMESEAALLKAVEALNLQWIYPRRYFYPSLASLNYVEQSVMPITDDICRRVLCLPLFHDLTFEEIDMIVRVLLRSQNY
jgi:dTDP-4-amino-4,6-dideoxygalactose transaminase